MAISTSPFMTCPLPTFQPPCFLRNPHVQTVLPFFYSGGTNTYVRKRFELDDGDFVDLDYCSGGPDVVLILHGLEGSSRSRYVLASADYLHRAGFSVCAMNFRGCSGEPNRRRESYHSGKSDDVLEVAEALCTQYNRVFILGFSVGGNIALKLLAEAPSLPITATVCVSVPVSLIHCAERLARAENRLYMRYFLKKLIPKVEAKRALFPDFPGPKSPQLISDFWEFDELITAPLFGFRSALHYYHRASSLGVLGDVSKNVLLINARDDPFLSPSCFPTASLLPPNFKVLYPAHGGHVGFVDCQSESLSWIERVALQYFKDLT